MHIHYNYCGLGCLYYLCLCIYFFVALSEKSSRAHNVRKRTACILGGVSLVILVVVCLGGYMGHKKFREHDRARKLYNWKPAIMRFVVEIVLK